MTDLMNRRQILVSRPVGLPGPGNVQLRSEVLPALQEGQVLIRNELLSLDPAIRDWMAEGPSYLPPIALGDAVRSTTLGKVVASRHPGWSEGERVVGLNAWEDYSIACGDHLVPIDNPEGFPLSHYLSIFGAVGMTSYFALLEVGRPIAGDTLLVSAAAGAVGSVVGQIGKLLGCRVVGLAGTDDKCCWLTDTLGFDAAVNYRSATDLSAAIAEQCPQGVDVFFDNVGGATLDAALLCINERARIVFCGAIGNYNASEPTPGPYNMWQILAHSARLEGFLVRDYIGRFPEGIQQMKTWVTEGRIQFREHVEEGLENALPAFNKLFSGHNNGKMILSIV